MSDQNTALFDKLDGFYVTKSEHDWLERRFSNMTEKEKILFQGAMELEKPQEIGHVMRIASQLDCYDLFYGAGDEAALGKFVMESIECSSDAARPFLNAEHLGAAYHQSQNGAFCNGHYVRNIKLADPFVEEDPTLQPVAGDYAIRVKLASRSNMEGIWVGFPDSGEYIDSNHPDELLLGLDSLQAESLSECIALEVDCCLPQLTGILDQYDSASELVRHAIDFGYVWAEQGQGHPTGWTNGRRCWSWRTATGWIWPWISPRISSTMRSSPWHGLGRIRAGTCGPKRRDPSQQTDNRRL